MAFDLGEDLLPAAFTTEALPIVAPTPSYASVGNDQKKTRVVTLDQPSVAHIEPVSILLLSYRDGLRMQIARDMAVLREDPVYHAPSREFYEQRIAAYRATCLALTPSQ